ncbi:MULTISPECIES: SDR family NAD(P)-dependent oxidoreductase [Mycolicibacter]|uniref:Oxidoreductase n=2 Tax=Mycolicibacter TaxID=1073531 RepID=A0AA91F3V6_9MYCO|nr:MULTISPECIES: glucose 1-dehydrogenase [Mycobacteriaceae]OBG40862.1 oxidoreductase [Mycolicibacter heraklionensis]OBJ33454.1 oxidoreductase [Mycolicibacter heraklionensis]OBK89186.1 oxidoreductase [Mycolicibacter heraklionensis]PQM49799.1 3-oxoacyl-ACP reductase [Mycolicibacter virginiensis]
MDASALNALFDLTGRTAIVTGGTRGIGLSVAHGLAAAGANVVVASRKPDACEQAAEQLRQAGAQAIGVPTHLGDIEAIGALVDATVERFGGVDIVINNAANALALPLGEITSEALTKSFAVNLQGPVFLVQAALPHLRQSEHAAIVNVVSAGAFVYSPATSMYSAAKAALVSFTRSMAAELASSRIRVNAIAPGPVNTDMVRNNPPEFIAALQAATLQQRIAEPDEMVGPVLLLVSDAGSYITGQTIHADGGMVAR